MESYGNIKFVVDRVAYSGPNNEFKSYITRTVPNLHCGWGYLYLEDGTPFQITAIEAKAVSKRGEPVIVEYEFDVREEDDPHLSSGAGIIPSKPSWQEEVPDTKIVEIHYTHGLLFMGMEEPCNMKKITVKEDGSVEICYSEFDDIDYNFELKFKVSEEDVRSLFDKIHGLLKNPLAYEVCSCDDSVGGMSYIYENDGYFSGLYATGNVRYDYTNTDEIFWKFLEEKCPKDLNNKIAGGF